MYSYVILLFNKLVLKKYKILRIFNDDGIFYYVVVV